MSSANSRCNKIRCRGRGSFISFYDRKRDNCSGVGEIPTTIMVRANATSEPKMISEGSPSKIVVEDLMEDISKVSEAEEQPLNARDQTGRKRNVLSEALRSLFRRICLCK